MIAFFKARRRSIILNWLVHLPVESRYARGTVVGEVGAGGAGGRRGGARQGRAEGESRFLYMFTFNILQLEHTQVESYKMNNKFQIPDCK